MDYLHVGTSFNLGRVFSFYHLFLSASIGFYNLTGALTHFILG